MSRSKSDKAVKAREGVSGLVSIAAWTMNAEKVMDEVRYAVPDGGGGGPDHVPVVERLELDRPLLVDPLSEKGAPAEQLDQPHVAYHLGCRLQSRIEFI